jgi:hypothetical protein
LGAADLAHDGQQTGRASQPYGASLLAVVARADGSLGNFLEAAPAAGHGCVDC